MCGRYNIIDDPLTQDLMEILGIRQHLATRYNIAPSEPVPVIRDSAQGRELNMMRWWLIPRWVSAPSTEYAMFNARMETLTTSRAFREPFRRQRCILPASSFIEWRAEAGKGGKKQPYEIRSKDHALAFAGLWEQWGKGEAALFSCTLITTEAVPGFQPLHKRMPVMLGRAQFEPWLDPAIEGEKLRALLQPRLPFPLEICPVAPQISNSRHKQAPVPCGERQTITN